MQAAFLSGHFTAHSPLKHNNRTASVTDNRLQVSKLCRCLALNCQPNAQRAHLCGSGMKGGWALGDDGLQLLLAALERPL